MTQVPPKASNGSFNKNPQNPLPPIPGLPSQSQSPHSTRHDAPRDERRELVHPDIPNRPLHTSIARSSDLNPTKPSEPHQQVDPPPTQTHTALPTLRNPPQPPLGMPPPSHYTDSLPSSFDLPPTVRDSESVPHLTSGLTPSLPTASTSMPVPPATAGLLHSQGSKPFTDAFAIIAPRKPGSVLASQGNTRGVQKPPRAKRRRLIGAGKHWALAVDKFVQDIPQVPYFSDPRRNAPQRDMRGWITIISKPAQKLVWDRLMTALSQDDLNENGDEDICRHILGSVVHEAQDPTSEKRQTRQAVNNAIKRELSLPKASGQTGRGETFRELFRDKAMGAGFRLTPVEKSEKDEPMEDGLIMSASMAGGPTHGGLGTGIMYRNGDQGLSGMRSSHNRVSSTIAGSDPPDTFGFGSILEPNEAARWVNIIRGCEKTPAGETAWWSSMDLRVHDMNLIGLYLVRTGNVAELKRLLVDFRWVRKFSSSSNNGIMTLVKRGYDVLLQVKTAALSAFEREGFRLIRNALMLVTPILRPQLIFGQILGPQDVAFCAHLGTQLYGRLLSASRRFAVVSTLLESIRVHIVSPWLRPLNPCFDAPKTDIALAVKSGPGALASAVAISPDGELLVTTGAEMRGVKQNVRVWEVSTGNCLTTIPVESVLMLAISPDKKHVVSVSMGSKGPLMFWNIVDEKKRYIENVKEETVVRAADFTKQTVFSVVITPDSQSVISACESSIVKWNIETGVREGEFDGVKGTIYSMDLSPDGRLLVAGAQQGVVGFWSTDSFKSLILIKNEGERVDYPKKITSGSDLNGTKLGDDIEQIRGGSRVFSVSFMMSRIPKQSTDNPFKVVAGGTNRFRIWSLPSYTDLQQEEFEFEMTRAVEFPGLGTINNMRCTDDESIFFASGDGFVRLWKADGNRTESVVLGTEPPVKLSSSEGGPNRIEQTVAIFLAVSDDGQKVAASTDRPFVLVWDVGQYEESIREQKGLRERPYFPGKPNSVTYTDIYTGPAWFPPDFNEFFSNSTDSKRELRILRKKENDNDLKLVFHPNMEERSVVFDQDIDLDCCRVGVFTKQDASATIASGEIDYHSGGEEPGFEKREGLGVRFKDKNIAFFEAERGPPKSLRPYPNS